MTTAHQAAASLSVPGIIVKAVVSQFGGHRFEIRQQGAYLLTAGTSESDAQSVRSHIRAMLRSGY